VGERLVIVLDTHALLWWISNPEQIPAKARRLLDRAITGDSPVAVSCISSWEIAMLAQRGRLELTMPVDEWIAHVENLSWIQFLPVDNRVALRSTQLEGFPHRDPADRLIVSTTLVHNGTLITADDRLRSWKPVRTLWD
jgi:PIN domain nuclease of toxin-antitoxin system